MTIDLFIGFFRELLRSVPSLGMKQILVSRYLNRPEVGT